MKYYIIYETINLINDKRYIGKHISDNLGDDYLGSGIVLNRAIKKYGKHNFIRNNLFVFDNELEMNVKEKELITDEIINSDKYYNVSYGGNGGKIVLDKNHPLYDEVRLKIKNSANTICLKERAIKNHKLKIIGMHGKKHSNETKEKMKETWKRKKEIQKKIKSKIECLNCGELHYHNKFCSKSCSSIFSNKNRTLSEETKNKISRANKGRKQTDKHKKKNSDAKKGIKKLWINNGIKNSMLWLRIGNEEIPDGW